MTLDRPTFTTTKLREGYDMGEVDQAVDLIFNNLALPEQRFGVDQITGLRFTPVRLREGYDIGEVDQWLDLAAAETARRKADGVPLEQAQPAYDTRAAPPPAPAHAPAVDETTSPTVVTEVRAAGAGLYLLIVAIIVVAAAVLYALVP